MKVSISTLAIFRGEFAEQRCSLKMKDDLSFAKVAIFAIPMMYLCFDKLIQLVKRSEVLAMRLLAESTAQLGI